MKRLFALVTVLVLLLAACGGDTTETDDGGEDNVETTQPATTEPAGNDDDGSDDTVPPSDDDGDTGESDDDSGDPGEPGANMATVTIGDTTWEFDADPEGTITDCDPDFFGAFWVIGEAEDGSGLNLLLPPEGDPNFEDPPNVRVTDQSSEADWTADETLIETYPDALAEGDSQVDSYTVDGNTASGTATFVDENQIFAVLGGSLDAVEPVTGTFEVSCSG